MAVSCYQSPLGLLWLRSDDDGLSGLWIEGQKHFPEDLRLSSTTYEPGVATDGISALAFDYLDRYFARLHPDELPPLKLEGTEFQKRVWDALLQIPYGTVTTYKSLAQKIASERGLKFMAAQAIGSAVSRNPVSIFVPCHRVIGSDGDLRGYSGGLKRKQALLELEGVLLGDLG